MMITTAEIASAAPTRSARVGADRSISHSSNQHAAMENPLYAAYA